MNILHVGRLISEFFAHSEHLNIVLGLTSFIFAFFETLAFVGYFIPGMVMIYTLGSLAARYHLSIVFMICTAIGSLCADLLSFHFGAEGGQFFKKQMEKREEIIKKSHLLFEKYGIAAIILGKMIGVFRPITAFIAGGIQMNYRKFIISSLVASVIWATTYTALVLYVQKHMVRIIDFTTNFGGMIAFLIMAYFVLRQHNRPSSHPDLSHLQKKP